VGSRCSSWSRSMHSLDSFLPVYSLETQPQGPCHHNQHIISQSGLVASVARLLATNLDTAGEASQLQAGQEQEIALPKPLAADTADPDTLVPVSGVRVCVN
jgi:hypothetical protein